MHLSPAFTVGISGHMSLDPNDVDMVGDSIRAIFDWLTQPGDAGGINGLATLGAPPGLSAASIVLLSSLAPGVDQIAVNIACMRRIRVQAPLPFPHPLYRDASTFKRGEEQDAERQADYDSVVEKVGIENLFFVERPGDPNLDAKELEKTLRRDLKDPVGRKYRYRAAGEFIATNCDLLIAVCDRVSNMERPELDYALPLDGQAGATFVVEACLYGATPEVLPMKSSLSWSDNGPVVRIFVRNTKRELPKNAPPKGHLAVWHPIDSRSMCCSDDEWHQRQMASLRDLAFRVEDMNHRFDAMTHVNGASECAMLLSEEPPPCHQPQTLLQRIWMPADGARDPTYYEASRRLQELAGLRRKAASVNSEADTGIKMLISRFLLVALAIVVLLQFCENWIPSFIEQQNRTESIGHVRAGLFFLAVALVGLNWIIILRVRKSRDDERQNDYRAIAEALRVQFFWNAGGTGESVDQRYLQRQRNELSWIRAVVSSVSIPVSRDRDEFDALSEDQKLERLTRIHNGWVQEQLFYFQRVTFLLGQRKHWLHFWANTLLIAGILMTLAGIGVHLLSWEHLIARFAKSWGGWALIHVLVALLVCFLLNELINLKAWKRVRLGSSGKTDCVSEGLMKTARMWQDLQRYSDRICHNSWVPLLLGILLGAASISTVFGGHWDPAWFPNSQKLSTLLKNLFLAGAGLIHSWAAYHFLSQNVRRYSTMLGLHRGANHRMARLLERLKGEINGKRPPEDARKTIRAIQSLLVELGVESLNENSEWLQMHRTTPIAPLMPVG